MKIHRFDVQLFMVYNLLGLQSLIKGGLNQPPANWDNPHPDNERPRTSYIEYLYQQKQ